MSAPPPQLGYMAPLNLSGYVPTHAKEPHLWQKVLASFLGNTAGEFGDKALGNMMAPATHIGPDGKISIDPSQHWWQRMTPEQTALLASRNAEIGNVGAQTARTQALTPGEVAKQGAETSAIQAGTGKTQAETQQISQMTPVDLALRAAQVRGANADSAYRNMLTNFTPGSMQAENALKGAQGNLLNAQAGWVGPEAAARIAGESARTGLTGAQQQETEAQTKLLDPETQRALFQLQMMRNYFPQSGVQGGGTNYGTVPPLPQ